MYLNDSDSLRKGSSNRNSEVQWDEEVSLTHTHAHTNYYPRETKSKWNTFSCWNWCCFCSLRSGEFSDLLPHNSYARSSETLQCVAVDSSRVHPAQHTATVCAARTKRNERGITQNGMKTTAQRKKRLIRDICIVVVFCSLLFRLAAPLCWLSMSNAFVCCVLHTHPHTQTRDRAHFRLHVSTRERVFCCCFNY